MPRVLRPTRALALATSALVAVSVGLTGCTTLEKAHSAAIVNGTPISDSELAEANQQYNTQLATSADQQITESQTLGLLVLAPFVLPQVAKSGSWKPDARYNSALLKIPDATQATKDFLATSIAVQALTQQDIDAILAELKTAKVELDPRYGTFDPAIGGSIATIKNWVKPTASATSTAETPQPTDSPTGQ